MTTPSEVSGVVAVGLRALQDRTFFEQLLADPASAVSSCTPPIQLTDSERASVIDLIASARQSIGTADALSAWDRYHDTLLWRPGWPLGWAPWAQPGD